MSGHVLRANGSPPRQYQTAAEYLRICDSSVDYIEDGPGDKRVHDAAKSTRWLHQTTPTSGLECVLGTDCNRCLTPGSSRHPTLKFSHQLSSPLPARRYPPVRSRCLHPGQQQGRRWPSSSSSWVRRMRRSRVSSCLAFSTQQMNSLRARGVMSFHASRAVGFGTNASRKSPGSLCTALPGTRGLLTGPRYRVEPTPIAEPVDLGPIHRSTVMSPGMVVGRWQRLELDRDEDWSVSRRVPSWSFPPHWVSPVSMWVHPSPPS